MRRLTVAAFAALLALGLGLALADEVGVNAWCFRPTLHWHLVPDTDDAYVPSITCEERELPEGDGDAWSLASAIEAAIAPEDWEIPATDIAFTTRWGWTYEYDAATGESYVGRTLNSGDGRSPTNETNPDPFLVVRCQDGAYLRILIISDVAPLNGAYAVLWWTASGDYRVTQTWEAWESSSSPRFFVAEATAPADLWTELRNTTSLRVLIFGDGSWRAAAVPQLDRLDDLDITELLDYCGQPFPADDEMQSDPAVDA